MSQQDEILEYSSPAENKLLGHSYDGIQEYDNPLPGWWKAIFWVTIIFAPFYFFHYHMGGMGTTIHENYRQEVASYNKLRAKLEAKRAKLPVAQQIAAIIQDKKALAEGKKIFTGKGTCFTCHGVHGEGKIGPNLTDNYAIHGPSSKQIFRVIREGGRPGKGMIPWGKVLKYKQILLVAAYVKSLQGTKPSNPKPPEKDAKPFKLVKK